MCWWLVFTNDWLVDENIFHSLGSTNRTHYWIWTSNRGERDSDHGWELMHSTFPLTRWWMLEREVACMYPDYFGFSWIIACHISICFIIHCYPKYCFFVFFSRWFYPLISKCCPRCCLSLFETAIHRNPPIRCYPSNTWLLVIIPIIEFSWP